MIRTDHEQIGFFHLQEADCANALAALQLEIDKPHPKTDSIIILPEAVNFGANYMDGQSRRQLHCSFETASTKLKRWSDSHGITFIAGLMQDQQGGIRRSSAYCFKPHMPPQLICHKMTDDNSGQYDPIGETNLNDWCNPVTLGHLCLAVWICSDGINHETSEYRTNVLRNMCKSSDSPELVVCYPPYEDQIDDCRLNFSFRGRANAGSRKTAIYDGPQCINSTSTTGILWVPNEARNSLEPTSRSF